ncbi:UDP-N-acetylmuramoylpentapeptide-lysine N(6)-alanyltransferase [Weissella halotolerans]|uniref:Uncharacterized protein n=2 Tax=Weissella halotolerans TaxID=1615 RepID=A0A0R2FW57_9LACO|nr:hypothetical protein IV68_GL000802 [Weissella halotolerans DSM 20190]
MANGRKYYKNKYNYLGKKVVGMPMLDRNDQKQVAAYQNFVRTTPSARVTQDLAWGSVKNNWEARDFYVQDADGQIKAALSVLLTDTPAGKKFAYASKGPVMATFDLALLDALLAEALPHLSDAYVLRMDPEVPYSDELNQALQDHGFQTRNRNVAAAGMHATIQPRLNMVMDLTAFPEAKQTLDLYPSKTKSKLKRPIRDGVTVTNGATAAELADFYTTYEAMAKRHGITYRPKAYFERMQAAFGADIMQIFVARRQGQLLSTGIGFKYGDKVWYMYAGSVDGETYYAPYAVQTAMIQWALDNGVRYYDMGGIGEEDRSDHLYLFKHVFVKAPATEYIGEIDRVIDPTVYAKLVEND